MAGRPKNPNITDEERARKRAAQMRWLTKKKEQQKEISMTEVKTPTIDLARPEIPNYKKLYTEEAARVQTCNAKITELEKLCKSYAEQAEIANANLKKATLEYNARIKYTLDCIRHCQISVQLATTIENGGNN